jgi:hypothetical protein
MLEEEVNTWLACAFDEYPEVMPMLNSMSDSEIKIEMMEKVYTIVIDGESMAPKEIKASTASAKVQRFLDECNAKYGKKGSAFDSIQEALNFMIAKF